MHDSDLERSVFLGLMVEIWDRVQLTECFIANDFLTLRIISRVAANIIRSLMSSLR
jgi:hypothetical protein